LYKLASLDSVGVVDKEHIDGGKDNSEEGGRSEDEGSSEKEESSEVDEDSSESGSGEIEEISEDEDNSVRQETNERGPTVSCVVMLPPTDG
jgi:hypothetical protein